MDAIAKVWKDPRFTLVVMALGAVAAIFAFVDTWKATDLVEGANI